MKPEISQLAEVIRSAGRAVMQIRKNGFTVERKSNESPLTLADLEANRILKEYLMERFPDYGWLSEETFDHPDRLLKRALWIVDPIDGTKEFVTGIPEFAISVALVRDGNPVMAAVYNPATEELFTAVRGQGLRVNGEANRVRRPMGDKPLLLASRTEMAKGKFKPFEGVADIKPVGSIAYKLALLAAGRADAIISLEPKNEWDIAAGVLLIEESDGKVTDLRGSPLIFNRADTLVDGIVAAGAGAYD
ncbi:MAG: 3'(2'),5'-bisphosphate nucleotidase CysQ, partial [Candidatus Binatia bacterium]